MTTADYVAQYRPEPAESEWPGRWIEEYDVRRASGDPRDWFTVDERLQGHLEAQYAFRKHRGEDSSEWESAVILFSGPMGSGNSVLMSHEACKWFKLGHPFFQGGGHLFGRHLVAKDLLDWHHNVPEKSVVAVDALEVFDILQLLALIQKGCRVLIKEDWRRLGTEMRDRISEIRMPSRRGSWFYTDRQELAYQRIDGYPLRGLPDVLLDQLVFARPAGKSHPAGKSQHITGAEARTALLLTDTFAPISIRYHTVRHAANREHYKEQP